MLITRISAIIAIVSIALAVVSAFVLFSIQVSEKKSDLSEAGLRVIEDLQYRSDGSVASKDAIELDLRSRASLVEGYVGRSPDFDQDGWQVLLDAIQADGVFVLDSDGIVVWGSEDSSIGLEYNAMGGIRCIHGLGG